MLYVFLTSIFVLSQSLPALAVSRARAQFDSLRIIVEAQEADSIAQLAQTILDADTELVAALPVDIVFLSDTPSSILLMANFPAEGVTVGASFARKVTFDLLKSRYQAEAINDSTLRLPWELAGMVHQRLRVMVLPPTPGEPPPPPNSGAPPP